jgi:hypothetical protein
MNFVRNLRRRLHTAAKLFGEMQTEFHAGGVSQSITYCRRKASQIIRERRSRKVLPGATVSAAFDREFGVDTTSLISLTELTIDSPNYLHATLYKTIDPSRIEQALQGLKIHIPDYTFVDVGSGKGLALLLASNYPFRKVIGVEFALELHQIATSNIQKYQTSKRQCADVQSLHMDATLFDFPETPLVLYLYHPFEEPLMKLVIARLRESYSDNPRPLVVLYVQPKVRQPLDDADFLTIQDDIPRSLENRNQPAYVIYASKEAAWR